MWVVDEESLRFLDVNEAAIALYGYSHDEFLAMTLCDLGSTDDKAVLDRFHHQMSERKLPDGENRCVWCHVRKDGFPIHVEVSVSRVTIGGRPSWMTSAKDATEQMRIQGTVSIVDRDREQMAAALRREKEENRNILDHV